MRDTSSIQNTNSRLQHNHGSRYATYFPLEYFFCEKCLVYIIMNCFLSYLYSSIIKERDFTLSDFKFIYYMEYGHRMWGRMIGVAFLVPAAFFLSKGWVNRSLKFRLAGNAALLGFQVRFMNLPMNI